VTDRLRIAAVLLVAVLAGVLGCGGTNARPVATGTRPAPASRTHAPPPGPAPSRPGRRRRRRRATDRPRVVARGIPFASNVAFDAHHRMWVTSGAGGPRASDGVWYVPRRGRPRHVASHLTTALGLRWVRGTLYVGHITAPSNGRVTALSGFDGRRFRRRRVALDGLAVGRHTVDSIVRGPHSRLYVGVGSSQDNRGRPGRVLSFRPGGHVARLEATGLRNPYGLAFSGRRLLVTDNGRDDLGAFAPPEELNAFDPSGPVADFGFPGCHDQGGRACAGTRKPVARFPAHASSDGLAVTGRRAYIAENGSSFAANPTGSDVRRVDLLTGRSSILWRSPIPHDPLGAAIGPGHDLYVTLFASGRVIRFRR
jgi:glucose/arabinose dehydrogenase